MLFFVKIFGQVKKNCNFVPEIELLESTSCFLLQQKRQNEHRRMDQK